MPSATAVEEVEGKTIHGWGEQGLLASSGLTGADQTTAEGALDWIIGIGAGQ
jgi:hypothetical protein